MVLFSFSIAKHIPLILSSIKCQTTRQPRKPRANGAKPYSVGEKVQLYYRSRQKSACSNCLESIGTHSCEFLNSTAIVDKKHWKCPRHSNFFGESIITEVVNIRRFATKGELPLIAFWADSLQEDWAIADGFTDFSQTDDFFKKSTKDKDWTIRDWDIIKWDGTKIARRVA